MERTCYDVLGIEPGAHLAEIKSAFRRLAKRYHPDTNCGDPAGEERFQEILAAYRLLSSPEKRALYAADLAPRAKAPPAAGPGFLALVCAFFRILCPPDRPGPAGRPSSTRPARKGERARRRSASPPFEEVLAAVRKDRRCVTRMCEDGVIRRAVRSSASARKTGRPPGPGRRYRVVGALLFFLCAWWDLLTR